MVKSSEPQPQVCVVALNRRTGQEIVRQLKPLLEPFARVLCCTVEDTLPPRLEAKVVLTTLHSLVSVVSDRLAPGSTVMVIRRTLTRETWEKVVSLPAGIRCLVVNDCRETAEETVSLLHELGARHLDLIPYWPGMWPVPPAELAITPGEAAHVPPEIPCVLDIGPRVVDASTVADVLGCLGLIDAELHKRISSHMQQTMSHGQGLRLALGWLAEERRRTEAALDMVQVAVVAYDSQGRIVSINRVAQEGLGLPRAGLLGQYLWEVIPDLRPFLASKRCAHEEVVRVAGKHVVLNHQTVAEDAAGTSAPAGGVFTWRDASAIQALEQKVRRQLAFSGFRARYSFSDLIGEAPAFREALARARKAAQTEAPILIEGETGTGKELLAHAVHLASPRSRGPFVAVNCAALPETLLESELFGYEDGAFTGARRGGKPGLVELAHRGTLFLDEVSDLSPSLQARLLRVLQEKEVVRLGGTRLISVDIRCIAASSQPVSRLVAAGKFRADLYYRLAAVRITMPPLRERKEDIPLLVRHFLQQAGDTRELSPQVQDILMKHDWPGNVRELKNVVEYMCTMAEGAFTPRDLPADLGQQASAGVDPAGHPVPTAQGFPDADWLLGLTREDQLLISELAGVGRGRSLGRQALTARLTARDPRLTEHVIRTRLRVLAEFGLIEPGRGRRGARLTPAGWALAAKIGAATPGVLAGS